MSRIDLTDDADTIANKLKRAKSDADVLPSEPAGLEGRPEARNLVGIYAALADETSADTLARFGGQGFGVFKPALADLAVARIAPIAERVRELEAAPDIVEAALEAGAERARAIAAPILAEVRRAVGFMGT